MAAAENDLKDKVDKLKSDLSNLMDLLDALKNLVEPMANQLMHLENDAKNLAQCCS